MTSFGIKTAEDFLQKLCDEQNDFLESHCLSDRHALNAIMTAYHLQDWVRGEMGRQKSGRRIWNASPDELRDEISQQDAIQCAGKITNGTKHFQPKKIKTGEHKGWVQRDMVQEDAFDVSYLWLERNGEEQRAENFIQELVTLWEGFFKAHCLVRNETAPELS